MPKRQNPKPHYPLSDVKKLISAGKILIQPNATQDAWDDFGWKIADIKKCLLKLNDKYHSGDKEKNHFYKSAPHTCIPNTVMDYYKCKNIMKGISVYTHFYIHPNFGNVIVSSFKEL